MNKIFRFFYTCMAVCGIAAAVTSCSDDNDPTFLDEVKVSQSIIAFSPEGGSVTISVNAAAEWTIGTASKDGMPDWVTISALSGGAGTQDVTFTATASEDSREALVYIECAGKKQLLTLQQLSAAGEPVIISVAEAVAMMRENQSLEKTVYVKGIVCKIDEISPSYGNATFYLSDDGSFQGKYSADGTGDGNWFEAYRVKWLNNANFTTGEEFSIGDEIVVTGVIMSYKGTPEIKEKTGYVYSYTPSLIKVDSLDVNELPIEGGIVNAALVCKGNGINVEIPAEAQSWLSVIGIDTKNGNVKFKAAPNTGGDRSTSVTFKTVDNSGKEYSAAATISQKGAILEVSAAAFNAAPVGDTQYRLTGVITELYASDSQGKSFYVTDYSGTALVFRAEGFKESGAKVGDVVTVVGKRGAYNNNPQMTSGTFEELKYAVTQVTIAEFLTKPESSDTYYMVTGIVDKIDNATYGNVYIKDGETSLFSYGCYPGWGATGDARKNCIATKGIEVGDKLTLIGVKGSKNGVPQISNGIYFSHEKVQPADAPGTEGNPFTVAEAIAKCQEIGTKTDGVIYYAKGKISSIKEVSVNNGNATFNISDDGQDANAITVFRTKYLGNANFTAEDQIKVGDEVIMQGKLVNYQAKDGTITPEFSGNVQIYSLNGKTE